MDEPIDERFDPNFVTARLNLAKALAPAGQQQLASLDGAPANAPAHRLSLTPELLQQMAPFQMPAMYGDPMKMRPNNRAIEQMDEMQRMNAVGRMPE